MAFRYGDETEVRERRARLLARIGIDPTRCAVMQVEHGERIVALSGAEVGIGALSPEAGIEGEALMTNVPGLCLFLLTADCLPVVFFDPFRRALALAHLGWKPTMHGLAAGVVHAMAATYGCDPTNVYVHIGPGIGATSYVFDAVTQADDPAWRPFLERDATGKWHVDLAGYNMARLIEVGVLPERITIDAADTATSDRYFSHYRSVRTGEPEARFATVVALRADSKVTVQ